MSVLVRLKNGLAAYATEFDSKYHIEIIEDPKPIICLAITKAGTPCTRRALRDEDLCKQHLKLAQPKPSGRPVGLPKHRDLQEEAYEKWLALDVAESNTIAETEPYPTREYDSIYVDPNNDDLLWGLHHEDKDTVYNIMSVKRDTTIRKVRLSELPDSKKVTHFYAKNSAISQARLAANNSAKAVYVWKANSGYFASKYNSGKSSNLAEHSNVLRFCVGEEAPDKKANMPGIFTKIEGYLGTKLCYPVNIVGTFKDKEGSIYTYGDLTSAREKATASSLLRTGIVYLARSNKKHNSAPWVVFVGKVPHPSMNKIAEYINGMEVINSRLDLNSIPQSMAVAERVYSVVYEDAYGNSNVSYVRAASAEDAGYLAHSGVVEEDGSVVANAGFKIIEVVEMANESSEETLRIMEEYAREVLRYGAGGEYKASDKVVEALPEQLRKQYVNWEIWERQNGIYDDNEEEVNGDEQNDYAVSA